MMVLNALFPVIAIICAGIVLQKTHFLDAGFFRNSDRLVYFVLFPVLLFWKIGAAPLDPAQNTHYLAAIGCAVLTVFIVSLLFVRMVKMEPFKVGSFSQSCYRFNTYIGMAVVINLFDEKGVQLFGILVGLVIPFINVLSVSVLIWFSGKEQNVMDKFLGTIKSLLVNPLIIGCLCGLAYARLIGGFPSYVSNSLQLLASTTLPLALLSIGGSLTFHGVRGNFWLAMAGSCFKLVVLPLFGLFFLAIFGVTGQPWQVSLLYLSLPTSTAIYVLSSQLNSDTDLASAAIVVSTCCAFVTMSIAIYWISV